MREIEAEFRAMEIYQLRSFAAVAELGNLTRAAEKLHVSQPAVSAQIKALENELAAVLFVRTATGMVLTAAGRRLLPEATKVISAVQELRAQAQWLEGEVAGRALVGTLSDPDVIRIGEFLGRAVERHPLLEIELHQEISGTAFEKLREGVLDASFYYGDLAHPQVAFAPLRDIAYRVVAPARPGRSGSTARAGTRSRPSRGSCRRRSAASMHSPRSSSARTASRRPSRSRPTTRRSFARR